MNIFSISILCINFHSFGSTNEADSQLYVLSLSQGKLIPHPTSTKLSTRSLSHSVYNFRFLPSTFVIYLCDSLSARLYPMVALAPVDVKLCGEPQNCHAQQELKGVPAPTMFCLIFKQSNAEHFVCHFGWRTVLQSLDSSREETEEEEAHLRSSSLGAKPAKGVQCLLKSLTSIIQLCFDIFRTSYQALSLCHCLSHFVSHSISYLTLMLYFNAFNCSLYRSHSHYLSLNSTLTQLTLSLTLSLSPYYLTPTHSQSDSFVSSFIFAFSILHNLCVLYL